MKKNRLFFQLLGIGVFAISLFMVSCTKEGAMGPAGADGTNGVDGTNGTNGTTVCLECHNETVQSTITAQYESSVHGGSQNFYPGSPFVKDYAGGRNGCAKCHSNEGFILTQTTGLDTTATDIANPTNITCKTCHGSHSSLDSDEADEILPLRTKAPVKLLIDPTISIDLKSESNLCINCHQPRTAPPTGDVDGNFAVTSTHYGPHHGPQATMFAGIGGYEKTGGAYPTAYDSGHFKNTEACVTCHMNDKDGVPTHDWEPQITACQQCHTDATDFDVNNVQTDVEALMETLKAKLITAGLLDANGGIVTGTYTVDQAGALFNYEMIHDDKSMGVHNADYTEALLNESIASFN
ncbi:multiheme c-type cytochrome [Ancylomarina longa]|nr:cytochrome c3 family protein [Ancylomarina longa]